MTVLWHFSPGDPKDILLEKKGVIGVIEGRGQQLYTKILLFILHNIIYPVLFSMGTHFVFPSFEALTGYDTKQQRLTRFLLSRPRRMHKKFRDW